MESLSKLVRPVQVWDRYWFFPESLQRLGACRLLAFGLLIADLVYFTNFAWVFHKEIDRIFWEPILLLRVLHRVFGLGPPSQQALELIFIVTVIVAIGAFVGYRTRVCALGASVLYMYLIAVDYSWHDKIQHRHGIFVLLLLALSLSPCAGALSVDALLNWMRGSAERRGFRRDAAPETSPYARWPLRLIGIILCLVYFFSGLTKLRIGGLAWMNGDTLAYWLLQDADIYSIQLPLIVARFPTLLKALSVFVVVMEITFPVILFVPRLVWLYLPAGLGFHLGSLALMNTHFIWWWFTYMVFIDWDGLAFWLKARFAIGSRPASVEVIYDGACSLCIRSMAAVASLDWLRRIGYLNLMDWTAISDNYPGLDKKACIDEMHVIDTRTRKVYRGFFAFRRIAWEIPLLWALGPILYLPGVSMSGGWIYGMVAGSRLRHEEECTWHTCR